ncbi:Cell division protein FtsQ [Candidatus Providencia siddallii]|uniref:Cell division protein FtsQ n=1 Tax=Candidatus Providencia siddallii TaxID=1715285 RepID=A0A0M6W7Y5_9GAMM|nr:Cell division protein FtsQ [Candidatus Providencia siddallii]
MLRIISIFKHLSKKDNNNFYKQSNGRFLCGLFSFFLILIFIIYGSWTLIIWMKNIDRLQISKIYLTGDLHYTTNEDIKKAIFSTENIGTFMSVNITAIKNKIIMIPWIHKITVRKQWPDKLKIYIIEYIPYARWNDKNIIDKNGEIFNIPYNKINKYDYVLLYSPPGTQKDILSKYNFLKKILDLQKLKIKSFSISKRYAWQIVLDNNIRIELGKKNLSERLNRFLKIYPLLLQQITDKQIDYIDLRYTNGAAVG